MEYADRGSLDDAIRMHRFRFRAPPPPPAPPVASAAAAAAPAEALSRSATASSSLVRSASFGSGNGGAAAAAGWGSSPRLRSRGTGPSSCCSSSRASRAMGSAAAAVAAAAAARAKAAPPVSARLARQAAAAAAAAASAAVYPDCGDGTRFDLVSALRCLLDIAAGVEYLHTAGNVVHGDLKPTNVLLKSAAPGSSEEPRGGGGGAFLAEQQQQAATAAAAASSLPSFASSSSSSSSPSEALRAAAASAAHPAALDASRADARSFTCKLCDFGLSRLVDVTVQTYVSTLHYGTIAYQPPEVLRTGRMSRASDAYAFGLIALEIATGEKVSWFFFCFEASERVRSERKKNLSVSLYLSTFSRAVFVILWLFPLSSSPSLRFRLFTFTARKKNIWKAVLRRGHRPGRLWRHLCRCQARGAALGPAALRSPCPRVLVRGGCGQADVRRYPAGASGHAAGGAGRGGRGRGAGRGRRLRRGGFGGRGSRRSSGGDPSSFVSAATAADLRAARVVAEQWRDERQGRLERSAGVKWRKRERESGGGKKKFHFSFSPLVPFVLFLPFSPRYAPPFCYHYCFSIPIYRHFISRERERERERKRERERERERERPLPLS